MNDEFLIQYRRTPHRAFADDLYAQLTQERRPAGYARLVSTPARRFAAGLAALCLIAATVLLAAPGARATVGQLIRTIGGITFDFTTPPPDSSGATIIPERVVSLAEARAMLPFELRLPAWAPDGFVLQEDQVRIWLHTSGTERQTVSFTWLDPTHPQSIHMYIDIDHPASSWGQWLVGSESSVEEVVINGQPGALVRGGWENGQWQSERNMALLWQPEGAEATYMLFCTTQFTQVTLEDLIHMAESVR